MVRKYSHYLIVKIVKGSSEIGDRWRPSATKESDPEHPGSKENSTCEQQKFKQARKAILTIF